MTIEDIINVLRSLGRNGDSEIAHVTPDEKRMLEERGGSGSVNPNTGLREFFEMGIGGNTGGGLAPGGGLTDGAGMSTSPAADRMSGLSFDLSAPDAAPGINIGAPGPAASPNASAAPSFDFAQAGKLAALGLTSGVSSMMPATGMISNIASGKTPDQLSQMDILGMMPGGPAAMAISATVNAIASALGLTNQGLGTPGQSGLSDFGDPNAPPTDPVAVANALGNKAPGIAAAGGVG